jgi:small subunit ribosomal protein S21
LEVKVKKNNVEFALRLLKRKIKDSGLMVELRERQYYKKPSAVRSEKKKLGKVRNWLRQKEQNPDWCGEPPTSGLKEKIKKERIHYQK